MIQIQEKQLLLETIISLEQYLSEVTDITDITLKEKIQSRITKMRKHFLDPIPSLFPSSK